MKEDEISFFDLGCYILVSQSAQLTNNEVKDRERTISPHQMTHA